MNDPIYGLLIVAIAIVVGGGGLGFYADHQRRKYAALLEAEREAADHPGS